MWKLRPQTVQRSLEVHIPHKVKFCVCDIVYAAFFLRNARPEHAGEISSAEDALIEMGDRADDPAAAGLLGANVELGDEDGERGQMLEGGAEGFKCRRVDVGEGRRAWWDARRVAVARPMPEAAPVIQITLPDREAMEGNGGCLNSQVED